MTKNDILNEIDSINTMCNYDCIYYDNGEDCSHTECYKMRLHRMKELDRMLEELL